MDHVRGRVVTEDRLPADNRFHKEKVFTDKELSHLTPLHIYRFLAKKVYVASIPPLKYTTKQTYFWLFFLEAILAAQHMYRIGQHEKACDNFGNNWIY